MSEKIRVDIIIKGRVQGVCYRAFAEGKAYRYDINGYTKNLDTGEVEIVAEGDKNDVESFISELWKGPPMAIVKNIEIIESKYSGEFNDFSIRY